MNASTDMVVRVCSEILAPLINEDGGVLYIVDVKPDRVSLHLAGRCSGCPGVALTTSSIIEPAIRAVAGNIQVAVTAGFRVPPGARELTPPATADASSPCSA